MTGDVFANDQGLVAGHTYTILGVNEVTEGGKPVRLVKLRSPWVTDKYTGPWGNQDAQWNNQTKDQAGVTKEEEGIFHMPLSQFRKTFGAFAVGMYHPNWILSNAVIQPI